MQTRSDGVRGMCMPALLSSLFPPRQGITASRAPALTTDAGCVLWGTVACQQCSNPPAALGVPSLRLSCRVDRLILILSYSSPLPWKQIAVVAVMCKPHRCPHIAMTGNICAYTAVWRYVPARRVHALRVMHEPLFLEIKKLVRKRTRAWKRSSSDFLPMRVMHTPGVYCPGGPDSDFEYSTQSYTGYEVAVNALTLLCAEITLTCPAAASAAWVCVTRGPG